MKWFAFCVCFFFSAQLTAQREQVWVLGDYGLDFNSQPPAVIPMDATVFNEAGASVCDRNGQLLFYTDGDTVWNSQHNILQNGFALGGGFSTFSTSQGALIVPIPEQADQYYIFSLTSVENGSNGGKLFYSQVDISMNGGAGGVVPGQKSILLDSNLTEKLTGVVGSRCNSWVITRSKVSGDFKSYAVSALGVDPVPVLSGTGNLNANFYLLGGLTPASNGEKIVGANAHAAGGGLEVYDFDPVSGQLSNTLLLDDSELYYSACFSPDRTKVYAITHYQSANNQIYQFDLNAPSPSASKLLLGSGSSFDKLKLAPDGKIYFRTGNNYLGSIVAPNNAGLSCGFTPNMIPFNTNYLSRVLPNAVPVFEQDTAAFAANNLEGPCWSQLFSIEADEGGWDYVWSTGSTGAVLQIDTPGTYWVTYKTAPCVFHADTFHVRFPHGILPTITTIAACRKESNGSVYATTYPGDPVIYSYTWMYGTDTLSATDTLKSSPAGSYSLHVQTNTGCDTLLFFDIPEEDFQVSFEVSDTLICLGDTIELTNTSEAHFTNYHWAFGNGDTFSLLDPLPQVYSESGAYRLMLAGEGEVCKDTAYQTILVDQPLLPDFEVEPKEVCVGQPVYFFPKTDSTTIGLSWAMEEQLRIESNIQRRYQHGFASSGTLPVTLTVQTRACPDTGYTNSIRVYPFPEVDLGSDSSICLHGQPIYLKNLRTAPLTPYHQVWSTGDTTEVLKIVHPGTYTLSVTTEPIGCTTTESIQITKDCYIDIPNVFTPNQDGSNDYFFPRQLLSESVSRFQMQVFNRWGQIIFETNSLNGRGWDGRFNDKAQPMGVYLYRIEVGFVNGRQEQHEGNVTLLR